jgi:hypothetical protein
MGSEGNGFFLIFVGVGFIPALGSEADIPVTGPGIGETTNGRG